MDFKNYLRNKELSKTTVESYHYYLLDFIAFLDKETEERGSRTPKQRRSHKTNNGEHNTEPEHCTEKEIMLYLGHLQKREVSNLTRKYRLYALKHFFDYQIENNKREDNPAKRIKIKEKQKQQIYPVLSVQELQNLYQNYKVPKEEDKSSHKNWFKTYRLSRERNKVIIGLLIHQGITTAEVKRILEEDLDLRKGEIHIKGGKIGKDRTLELKSHQIIDLMEYQYKTRTELLKYQNPALLGKPDGVKQLFLSVPGSGKTTVEKPEHLEIWKSLTKELKQQNPKFINLQQIRTSVIVHWLKQYNLRQVQYRAGHKNIYSTEMYQINDVEDLQTEIERYHPLG